LKQNLEKYPEEKVIALVILDRIVGKTLEAFGALANFQKKWVIEIFKENDPTNISTLFQPLSGLKYVEI
jgi:hypothetical protein